MIATSICQARLLTRSIQKKIILEEVKCFFGALQPSHAHAQRVSKILRSEKWRQVRLLTDFLRVKSPTRNEFSNHLIMTQNTTEILWKKNFLPIWRHHLELHRQRKTVLQKTPLQLIGNVHISEQARKVLEQGPKFAIAPKLEAVDKPRLTKKVFHFGLFYLSTSFINFNLLGPPGLRLMIATSICQARLLTRSIQKKIILEEVKCFFGALQPSHAHAQRVSKILRSEKWRQVRLLTDFLRVKSPTRNEFSNHLIMTQNTTEILWKKNFLPIWRHHLELHRQRKTVLQKTPLQLIGNVHISEQARKVLEQGPKFAIAPKLEAVDKGNTLGSSLLFEARSGTLRTKWWQVKCGRVEASMMCAICGEEEETMEHLGAEVQDAVAAPTK
ncbi:hypothetical protein ISCGN_016647 [Ixodes scapularis]